MKKKGLITMFDPVHVDTEWDREDGHDRAVEQTPQLSSLPEDPQEQEQEQERVQQRQREEQEREMEREMYGRSCGATMRNPEWSGFPNHHDHDAVETGSDHHHKTYI